MEVPEFHQSGSLGISNHAEVLEILYDTWEKGEVDGKGHQVDVGLQVGADGRIWVCVNGMAFLRFKPNMAQMYVDTLPRDER